MLLSARPFVVGDRVRLQGGDLAGEMEGTVSSLGLLHTVLSNGEDSIMVPNRSVLNVAIIPLREPAGINLRARLRPGVTPLDIQQLLQDAIQTPTRGEPRILLEEIDGDEVVVRIHATPEDSARRAAAGQRGPRRDRPGDAPLRARGARAQHAHVVARGPTRRSTFDGARRSGSALGRLRRRPSRSLIADAPSCRASASAKPGRDAGERPRRRAAASGATSISRAVALDRPHDRAARRPRASACRRRAAA